MSKLKIEINEARGFHHLAVRMPEFQKEYGLWIISGGIDYSTKIDSFEKSKLRTFDFYSLSHMYEGGGSFEVDGMIREVKPGNMILICPGDKHRYGGSGGKYYKEDSIRFCGDMADAMRKKGILRSGLYRGKPLRVIKALVEQSRDPAFSSSFRATLRLQELLLDLYDDRKDIADPFETLLETLRKSPSDHWWRVTELAELIDVSADTLRREFLRKTGLLPKAYIEQLKIRQAAEMLLLDNLSVSEVGMHFGYRDCYHFSRRFKFVFGISPSLYRQTMSSDK